MDTTSQSLLEAKGLIKRYSGVAAIDQVSLRLHRGRVRALVGENGAGKSTLMKMLTGEVRPDAGTISMKGVAVSFSSPGEAARLGIGMVHQEVQTAPNLSVLDNLMLVRARTAKGYRRGSATERDYAVELFGRIGLDVKLSVLAGELSAAELQLLEIAKALALDAEVILFDEPTSALPPAEVERLLILIEALRADHAILYVSHHLAEIHRLADDLTVLRDGQVVAELVRGEASDADLVKLMVDRPVGRTAANLPSPGAEVLIAAKELATPKVRDLSFKVHAGEILGFAGLMGSGMHEAALALCGAARLTAGTLEVQGRSYRFKTPHQAAQAGVVLVPEERKTQAIVPDANVNENLHLGRNHLHRAGPLLDLRARRRASIHLSHRFSVRLRSLSQPIKTLSGGNQQKVILARCVQSRPKVLILSEPTRGVDVAAKSDIHRIILDLAASGTAIVVVSSELEELLELSHRVAVFSEGRLVRILDRAEATPVAIMSLATPERERKTGYQHTA